jgi:hypothetical protein
MVGIATLPVIGTIESRTIGDVGGGGEIVVGGPTWALNHDGPGIPSASVGVGWSIKSPGVQTWMGSATTQYFLLRSLLGSKPW